MPPRVSIITPLYNGEKYLRETIQSVLAQSFQDWELVLVDDGSKDTSFAIAQAWEKRDPRIRSFYQPNAGVAATRDLAAKELSSQGEFLLFLDQDDLLEPYALEELVRAADEHPECVAVHGFLKIIDGEGKTIPNHFCENHNWLRQRAVDGRVVPTPINELSTFETLTYLLFIYTPGSVLIRRSAFLKTGGLDQSVAPADDWDLYFKLTLQGPMYPLPRTVLAWRLHGENNTFNRAKIMSTTDSVYERYLACVTDPALRRVLEDGFLQFTRNRLKDANESEEIQKMLREREMSLSAAIAARNRAKKIRLLVILPSMEESCDLRDTLDLLSELSDRLEFRFIAMGGGSCEPEVRQLGDCRNVETLVKPGRSMKDRLTSIPRKMSWEKWIAEFEPAGIYVQSLDAGSFFRALKFPPKPVLVRELPGIPPDSRPATTSIRIEVVDARAVPVGASPRLTIEAARALDKDDVQSGEPYAVTSKPACPQHILEAMLRERPIVYLATDAQVAAIAAPAGVAVSEISAGLLELSTDEERRKELGRIGKQRVYDNFAVKDSANRLYEIMKVVIA
jgi:glycosyltransferase involved in cell wall biosynthesis